MAVVDLTCEFEEWKQLAFGDMSKSMQDWYKAMEISYRLYFSTIMENSEIRLGSHIDEIVPGIFVGDEVASKDYDLLLPKGIRHVLNMAIEIMSPVMGANIRFTKLGIEDCMMPRVGIWEKAAEVINATHEANLSQLVHCHMGISRSIAAMIAYFIRYRSIGFEESLALIRKARPEANPHPLLVRGMIRDFGAAFRP